MVAPDHTETALALNSQQVKLSMKSVAFKFRKYVHVYTYVPGFIVLQCIKASTKIKLWKIDV